MFLEKVTEHYVLADLLMNEQNAWDWGKRLTSNFVSYALYLHLPYNELYGQFHENTKRNIKAAQKQQSRVTIQEEKAADIIAMFRNNRGQGENVRFQDDDYTRLQNCCCGANGRFPMLNPEAAEKMTGEIVLRAYNQGAEFITSTDIHCLQLLDSYKQEHGVDIGIIHIADILRGEE